MMEKLIDLKKKLVECNRYNYCATEFGEVAEAFRALEQDNLRLKSVINTEANRAHSAEVEKAGAEERCRMMFDAKNHWAERARAAEAGFRENEKTKQELFAVRDKLLTANLNAGKRISELEAKLTELEKQKQEPVPEFETAPQQVESLRRRLVTSCDKTSEEFMKCQHDWKPYMGLEKMGYICRKCKTVMGVDE